MLDRKMLTAKRRRFFLEIRGGVYFPIAGAILWPLLGSPPFLLVGIDTVCDSLARPLGSTKLTKISVARLR
jgi:hypothetical protein